MPTSRPNLRKWFLGLAGAAAAILVGVGWGMSGLINTSGAIWCFLAAAGLLTAMLWIGEEFSKIGRLWKIIIGCAGTQIIGIGLLVSIYFVLSAQGVVIQKPYDLTGKRRERFVELLKHPQSEPRDIIRVGCLAWSDSACVAAGKFLILISEAGWKIDSNKVFRLDNTIPTDGVTMVSHTEFTEELPPHLGHWEKMDASQITIWYAFNQMGLPPHGGSDRAMPTGILGLYFGPEPRQQE